MNILGRKIENRTVLIVVAVILIVLAGLYIVVSLPPQINYLSVDDVLRNKDSYINKTIVIRGYYESNGPAIVSTTSDVTGKATLTLDHSGVQNASLILLNNKKYDFTGVLEEINISGPNNILIFRAVKIEVV